MEKWTKRKASESCGGHGMAKFVDSSEAKRLSRLKNIRSSIGNSMSHNGWQKQQIEKRRKEQLRQKKEEAKNKKPVGEGIKIETGSGSVTPYEFTKCGLKLKLSSSAQHSTSCSSSGIMGKKQQQEKKTTVVAKSEVKSTLGACRRKVPGVSSDGGSGRGVGVGVGGGSGGGHLPSRNRIDRRYYGPQTPEQRFGGGKEFTSEKCESMNSIPLLDDGYIVSEDVSQTEMMNYSYQEIIRSSSSDCTTPPPPRTDLLIHDRLRELSLNTTTTSDNNRNNVNLKKRGVVVSEPKFRSDEGKENGDTNINISAIKKNVQKPNNNVSKKIMDGRGGGGGGGASSIHDNKKQAAAIAPPNKKRFTGGMTNIHALKREHADAIEMLKRLDKSEGDRRRRIGSEGSMESCDDDDDDYGDDEDDDDYGDDEDDEDYDDNDDDGDGDDYDDDDDDEHNDNYEDYASDFVTDTETPKQQQRHHAKEEEEEDVEMKKKELDKSDGGDHRRRRSMNSYDYTSAVSDSDEEQCHQINNGDKNGGFESNTKEEEEEVFVEHGNDGINLQRTNDANDANNPEDDSSADESSSYFNSDDNRSLTSAGTDSCASNENDNKMDEEDEGDGLALLSHCNGVIEPNEMFAWLPDGLQNATHLSISLRDMEDGSNGDSRVGGSDVDSGVDSGDDSDVDSIGNSNGDTDGDGSVKESVDIPGTSRLLSSDDEYSSESFS